MFDKGVKRKKGDHWKILFQLFTRSLSYRSLAGLLTYLPLTPSHPFEQIVVLLSKS